MAFWSWDINPLTGGPYVYPTVVSLYDRSAPARWLLEISRRLHPTLLLLAAAGIVLGIGQARRLHPPQPERGVMLLFTGVLLYFTAVHAVLAPLPRYSVPLYGFFYLVAMYGAWQGTRLLGRLRRRERVAT